MVTVPHRENLRALLSIRPPDFPPLAPVAATMWQQGEILKCHSSDHRWLAAGINAEVDRLLSGRPALHWPLLLLPVLLAKDLALCVELHSSQL